MKLKHLIEVIQKDRHKHFIKKIVLGWSKALRSKLELDSKCNDEGIEGSTPQYLLLPAYDTLL